MTYVVRAMPLVLLSLLSIQVAPAQAEDACRQRFIECVQQTRNPLECHAVSAACVAEMAPVEKTVAVQESIQLTPRNGLTYAQMTIRNTSARVQEVGVRAWGVTCTDGSEETLYFLFGNATVLPGASLVSAEVVACFGHASATLHESTDGLKIPQSMEQIEFACDPDGKKVVTLKAIGEALVEYNRWDGVFGTYRLRASDGSDIVSSLCEQVAPAVPSLSQDVRKKANEKIIPFMGRLIEALGLTASTFDAKYNTTGTRN